MRLTYFTYNINGKTNQLHGDTNDQTFSLTAEDLVTLERICFPPGSEHQLTAEDRAELVFSFGGQQLWRYRLNATEEVLELSGEVNGTAYISLTEFIALHWGVASAQQLRNLLVVNKRSPLEFSLDYLNRAQNLSQESHDLLKQTIEALDQQAQAHQLTELTVKIYSCQREQINLNTTRRVLWAQVCRLQEQLEKFQFSMQSIVGSPIKPEQPITVQEARTELDAATQRRQKIEARLAQLFPDKQKRERYYYGVFGGIFFLLLLAGPAWLRLELRLALAGLGLILFILSLRGMHKTQASFNEYEQLYDELLDQKTVARRARKKLTEALAGEDEKRLWQRVEAQQEADRIRTELEYQLDRYTKAWQQRSIKDVQAKLMDFKERFQNLLEFNGETELSAAWQIYWQKRQSFLAELEPAAYREPFWAEELTCQPDGEGGDCILRELLIPEGAPKFYIVNANSS